MLYVETTERFKEYSMLLKCSVLVLEKQRGEQAGQMIRLRHLPILFLFFFESAVLWSNVYLVCTQ